MPESDPYGFECGAQHPEHYYYPAMEHQRYRIGPHGLFCLSIVVFLR